MYNDEIDLLCWKVFLQIQPSNDSCIKQKQKCMFWRFDNSGEIMLKEQDWSWKDILTEISDLRLINSMDIIFIESRRGQVISS